MPSIVGAKVLMIKCYHFSVFPKTLKGICHTSFLNIAVRSYCAHPSRWWSELMQVLVVVFWMLTIMVFVQVMELIFMVNQRGNG